jgi:hypothetical protein
MNQIKNAAITSFEYIDTLQKEKLRLIDQLENNKITLVLFRECQKDLLNKIKAHAEEAAKFL